jgi:hypothetical protein
VTHLLAAHVEAERLAGAAGGPDGWWVIEPRYSNPFFEIGSPPPEPDHAVIHNMQGGDPVVYIDIGDVDTAKRKAETLLIQANNPRTVLARVVAERELLAEHSPDDPRWPECIRCADDGTDVDLGDHGTETLRRALPWPCRTVLGLAKAWGWEEPT